MNVEFVGGPIDGATAEIPEGLSIYEVLMPVYPMSDMVGEPDSDCIAAAVKTYKLRYLILPPLPHCHYTGTRKAVFQGYARA